MAKSVQQQIQDELDKVREANDRIKKLKAKEAARLGRIADKVGLYEVAVSEDDIAAGLEHAMSLARGRTNGAAAPVEDHANA